MVFVKRIIGRESTEGKRTKEGIKTKKIIDLKLTDQTLPYKLIYIFKLQFIKKSHLNLLD